MPGKRAAPRRVQQGRAAGRTWAHGSSQPGAALAALPPSRALRQSRFCDRGRMSAGTGAQARSAAALHPPCLGAPAAPTR